MLASIVAATRNSARWPVRWIEAGSLACIAVALVFLWGRKGFHFFDQAFSIDIPWRLLHGQRMYRDFVGMPYGPLTYYLQALWFQLFGAGIRACLLHAAAVNVLATLGVYWAFVRRLPRPWPYVIALCTAVWFYGVVAWPWPERLSYLFAIGALLLWERLGEAKTRIPATLFCIGLLTGMATWDKQNIALVLGVVQTGLCLGWVVWRRRPLLAGWYVAGGITALLLFLGVLATTGTLDGAYHEYYLRAASLHRFTRLAWLPYWLSFWGFLGSFFVALIAIQTTAHGATTVNRWRTLLICAAAITQWVNGALSSMGPVGHLPFVGLILGWWLVIRGPLPAPRSLAGWARQQAVAVAAACCLLGFGLQAGSQRIIWHIDATTVRPLSHPFFRSQRVQQPGGAEFDSCLGWLMAHMAPTDAVWFLPAGTVGYIALGTVSSAPIVAMEATILKPGDDDRLLHWLQTTPPTWIAMNLRPAGPHPILEPSVIFQRLPKTMEFVKTHYTLAQQLPGYEIYRLSAGQ